ncbi:MAG: hypothetical protein AABX75_02550 [Nanoarchaeota archaeon]
MLFIIFSILDVLAGSAIFSPAVFKIISGIIWALALVILAKGAYSILCSFSAGYFFEWPGALDLVAGACLLLLAGNIVSNSHLIGGIFLGKGLYYFGRSVLGV